MTATPPNALQGMRVSSIVATDAEGGAEFAAIDVLVWLRDRGADCVLITNRPELARGTDLKVRELRFGRKLNARTAFRFGVTWPLELVRLYKALLADRYQRGAAHAVLLHFKKEQLLSPLIPRPLTGGAIWFEWGPLPPQFRHGLPRLLYRWASRRPVAIVAESDTTKKSLLQAGVDHAKTLVVPNVLVTVDEGGTTPREDLRQRWDVPADAFVLGAVTRLHPTKRLDVVVEAMHRLPAHVHLILAGSGPAKPDLENKAAAFGTRVHFVETPRGHVDDLLRTFDVHAYSPSSTEGSARAITLGQLAGLPTVATARAGTVGLITDETGRVTTPDYDVRTFAAHVREYVDDPDLARRDGERARRSAVARLESAAGPEHLALLLSEVRRNHKHQ